jgi:hypothetical protein
VFDRTQGLASDAQMAQMQELGVGYAKFWVPSSRQFRPG